MHDGVVLFTTPHITDSLGFPRDMWLGRSFIDFVHPKDRSVSIHLYRCCHGWFKPLYIVNFDWVDGDAECFFEMKSHGNHWTSPLIQPISLIRNEVTWKFAAGRRRQFYQILLCTIWKFKSAVTVDRILLNLSLEKWKKKIYLTGDIFSKFRTH